MNNNWLVNKISKASSLYPKEDFFSSPKICTCINPFSYHIVRNNRELYSSFDCIFVDGMTMCWYLNLFWNQKIPRLSFDMSGMAVDLFNRLNATEETIYFIGAKQDKLEATIDKIKKKYSLINIVGYRNGYFLSREHRDEEIKKIVKINPDFVIIGMGSPIQEQFALDLKNAGYRGIAFTCGGFLHQTADGIQYYPNWINRYNLRAFYRLYKERGLFKRLYNVLIEFPILFTWDTILSKIQNIQKRSNRKEN